MPKLYEKTVTVVMPKIVWDKTSEANTKDITEKIDDLFDVLCDEIKSLNSDLIVQMK